MGRTRTAEAPPTTETVAVDANAIEPPAGRATTIVPHANGSALAERPAPEPGRVPCGNLASALSRAQDKCRAAYHDRRNTHHAYNYASAEAVLLAAQDALDGCGLAVDPLGWRIEVVPNTDWALLRRRFQLLHESGEEREPVEVQWPILPDKGRPLDKALGAALTEALAYYYRDLLRMPRVKPDDTVAGRDDTSRGATAPAPASPAVTAQAPVIAPPQPQPAPPPARAPLPDINPSASSHQVSSISELTAALGRTPEQLNAWLLQVYGVGNASALTSAQAAEVIFKFEAMQAAAVRGSAAPTPKS